MFPSITFDHKLQNASPFSFLNVILLSNAKAAEC